MGNEVASGVDRRDDEFIVVIEGRIHYSATHKRFALAFVKGHPQHTAAVYRRCHPELTPETPK
ncbi:MAG: hypothetical protein KGL39_17015 [Patescibacteria group bacterium]|nr:hypothetical protein [Patescibacteria group bacterium]